MSDDSERVWWKTLAFGVFMCGLAVFLYFYFTDFETTGGSRRMNAIIAGLYNIGGKWLACSFVGLIGLIAVLMGIKEFKER
jgi:hypothetical protein